MVMTPSKRKQPDGCRHNDITSFERYTNDLGYFKSTYLDKNQFWPKQCDACAIIFVDKPESQIAEKEYKVCSKSPVFLCRNAANLSLPCTFGLCKECRYSVLGASPSRQRKRSRNLDEEFTQ
jgi:hypothetical protein